MRKIIFLFAILFSSLAFAVTPEEALKELLASPSLDPNQTAVYIRDIESDYMIVNHNGARALTPASVMKCVTVAGAKDHIPFTTSLVTTVMMSGDVRDGVLQGDLIVIGSGDPSLNDGRFKDQKDILVEIADALQENGITGISGSVIIDDSRFAGSPVPKSWQAGDLERDYGTGFHAFNFEANKTGKAAVKNPANVFKSKLEKVLAERGITLGKGEGAPAKAKKEVLLTHFSPPIAKLMESCMFRSDNLYAEAFLRLMSMRNKTDGSPEQAAEQAMRYWESRGYPMTGVQIVDGSGLSRNNSLTAAFLAEVLLNNSNDPYYVSFFPLTGEEGTVRNFMKGTPLEGRLALKTGSMSGIQSYAGYLLDDDYAPTHIIVVMTNNLKNRENYRAALGKFFSQIFLEN
ncbi:MAG: D-alanyl-D-alanine carboxypeptidase/D-alanyl-D-alanine-endopeptidase [Muribaculaceae bacterium]|nr:D-alanyl-D-alanine carboxypeptidase/D-alanyl-D-alanine-endopeptidase [Muribaculaceae bacterium]